MPPTRFDVAVAGGRLAVYELGDAPPPDVVAVHGITGNSHSWLTVAGELGERAGLLAVDLRGRGASSGLPGPYGLAAHVDDVLAVLDSRGLERAVVVGHSLGAYIVAAFALAHPERVEEVVLVDGGLRIPGIGSGDPRAAVTAFLGPTLDRLQMRFESRSAYIDWWRSHPALSGDDVDRAGLAAYAEHDLTGQEPELRSSVSEEAVYADGVDLLAQEHEAAAALTMRATLLCAPLGLRGEPSPMQPFELASAWAAAAPDRREAILVPAVNHYTITLGRDGARAVAGAIAGAAQRSGRS